LNKMIRLKRYVNLCNNMYRNTVMWCSTTKQYMRMQQSDLEQQLVKRFKKTKKERN
jgi:hypothetical protein